MLARQLIRCCASFSSSTCSFFQPNSACEASSMQRYKLSDVRVYSRRRYPTREAVSHKGSTAPAPLQQEDAKDVLRPALMRHARVPPSTKEHHAHPEAALDDDRPADKLKVERPLPYSPSQKVSTAVSGVFSGRIRLPPPSAESVHRRFLPFSITFGGNLLVSSLRTISS